MPAEIVAGLVVDELETSSPPKLVTDMLDPDTLYEDPIRVDCTAGPSTVNWTESVITDLISTAFTGDIIKKDAASKRLFFILMI